MIKNIKSFFPKRNPLFDNEVLISLFQVANKTTCTFCIVKQIRHQHNNDPKFE